MAVLAGTALPRRHHSSCGSHVGAGDGPQRPLSTRPLVLVRPPHTHASFLSKSGHDKETWATVRPGRSSSCGDRSGEPEAVMPARTRGDLDPQPRGREEGARWGPHKEEHDFCRLSSWGNRALRAALGATLVATPSLHLPTLAGPRRRPQGWGLPCPHSRPVREQ